MTFGNGPVMTPLRESLVSGRGVLTTDELLYAFTVARITPGPANSYVASIGYMLFGLPGAALCVIAVVAPGSDAAAPVRLRPAAQRPCRQRLHARPHRRVGRADLRRERRDGRASLTTPGAWIVFAVPSWPPPCCAGTICSSCSFRAPRLALSAFSRTTSCSSRGRPTKRHPAEKTPVRRQRGTSARSSTARARSAAARRRP